MRIRKSGILIVVSVAASIIAIGYYNMVRLSRLPDIDPIGDSICSECGSVLFDAIPGYTTEEDIREFARNSKLPDAEDIIKDGWIHPGLYCPNGCTEIFIEYDLQREKTATPGDSTQQ